jgi:hypothetical protein
MTLNTISLTGSAGAVTSGAAGVAVTPVWGAGDQTAGDLLMCWVSGLNHSTVPATPAGWAVAAQLSQGSPAFNSSTVFYKIATGGDIAPTIAGVTGIAWTAMLANLVMSAAIADLLDQALGITLNPGDDIVFGPAPTMTKTVNADGSIS